MTISKTTSRVQYVATGLQFTFPFSFKIFTDDNLNVYVDGVLQTLTTDYSIEHDGTENGGDVIFVVAPANTAVVLIERQLSMTQMLDLVAYDAFPAQSVEEALDLLTILAQQNDDANNRAITVPSTTDPAFDNSLTVVAGEYVRFTADGLGIESTDLSDMGETIVPTASTGEITAGTETANRLVSPAQIKLAVETHETPLENDVNSIQWIEVVTALPATPDANTLYLVK